MGPPTCFGAVVGTAGEFHLLGLPVDLRVMLSKPGVPEDDVPLAKARDREECSFGVSLVLQDEVDYLHHLACPVGRPIDVQHRDWA